MSATEAPGGAALTSGELRLKGLKLPPPEPPKLSLTIKIFLMAALLIFIAVGGAVVVSAIRSRAVADEKIAEDLKKSGPAWESFQQTRYAELQRSLAVVVNSAGTISLLTTLAPETGKPDAATVFDTLKREQASATRADFLVATDPKGVALARTDRPLPYMADLSGVPTIAGALQGDQTEGIWLSGGRLYDVVAAPVLEGGSRLVGVIAAGFQVNDEVARNLEQLLNTQVVFLADAGKPGEPAKAALAASTMGPLGAAALSAIEKRDDLVQAVLRQGKTIGPLALDFSGDTYLAYLLPLRSSSDQLVGAAVALRSRDRELAAFRQIQKTQIFVGLAALVAAFAASFFLARRITGPVARLLAATEQVRVGNLDTPELPVESKDEIGILARSFRAMLEELKEKAALEQYVASLNLKMSSSEAETAALSAAAAIAGGEPRVGEVFAARYEILGVLGRGGMGVVYRAHDKDLDDAVAIKTLRGEALSADPSLLDRFKQEIRLARRITHPNILRTHDLGETGGLRYLSMEFVRGLTLKQLIESSDVLPTPVGLRIAKQLCAGLAAAHEVGVIHRDIKPQNIIIEAAGGLKIMDFGIARLKEERGMTAEGTVVGTPDYMSPEQARGIALDFRSDIYSTGVVLYEVFTGTLPFEGDTPLAVVLKHIQENPPSPQARNPRVDPKISQIVLKCMQKDPKDRFQSVNDLYEALTKVTA
ncbi:MAG TPA: protein kinase [Thermoanaerobaculia bacterium]|nr:protein kinase [Thermoanaerobaculia bacterium]